MSTTNPAAIRQHSLVDLERQREEIDWMLNAIAGAIVTNRLPPNDAFAWARIAAHEAARLGAASFGASVESAAA
jgi:hypothetical protein